MTVGETTISLMKDELITGKTRGETVTKKTIETDKIIEGMTPNRGIGIGMRVETDQETIVVTILEVEIEIKMDRYNKELKPYLMTKTDLGLGPTQE